MAALSAKVGDVNVTVYHKDGKILANYVRGSIVEQELIEHNAVAALHPDALKKALKAAKAKLA